MNLSLQEIIRRFGPYPPEQILDSLLESDVFCHVPFSPQRIKTVGFFYNNWILGGVERVILKQFALFRTLGCRIVFFTNQPLVQGSFPIPPDIKVFILPPVSDTVRRMDFLSRRIEEEHIDLFYWHSYDLSLAELAVIKASYRLPVIQHFHSSVFPYSMTDRGQGFFAVDRWIKYRKIVDLSITLSRIDELFFRLNQCKAVYLPNPTTFSISEVPEVKRDAPHRTILWLARMDPWKKVLDIVPIMQGVLAKIPDAKMIVIGGPWDWDKATMPELVRRIAEAGLQDHIVLMGQQTDVPRFYRMADLYLSTSQFEGFPMSIGEALVYGLPMVAYDLPYVEYFLHPDSGILAVPQNNTKAAADRIADLLSDDALYQKISRQARETGVFFSEYDFETAWKNIFSQLSADQDGFLNLDSYPVEIYRIFAGTMQEFMVKAGKELQIQNSQLLLQNRKLQQTLQSSAQHRDPWGPSFSVKSK